MAAVYTPGDVVYLKDLDETLNGQEAVFVAREKCRPAFRVRLSSGREIHVNYPNLEHKMAPADDAMYSLFDPSVGARGTFHPFWWRGRCNGSLDRRRTAPLTAAEAAEVARDAETLRPMVQRLQDRCGALPPLLAAETNGLESPPHPLVVDALEKTRLSFEAHQAVLSLLADVANRLAQAVAAEGRDGHLVTVDEVCRAALLERVFPVTLVEHTLARARAAVAVFKERKATPLVDPSSMRPLFERQGVSVTPDAGIALAGIVASVGAELLEEACGKVGEEFELRPSSVDGLDGLYGRLPWLRAMVANDATDGVARVSSDGGWRAAADVAFPVDAALLCRRHLLAGAYCDKELREIFSFLFAPPAAARGTKRARGKKRAR